MPKPDFASGTRLWIEAGGAHHTVYAHALSSEFLADFAIIAGIELIEIK
ncbi:MAG: hypothetical protein KAS17_00400 [Victivallaceae bacterium]|nr:hypothetical protein [Victivallaceae bacterium]